MKRPMGGDMEGVEKGVIKAAKEWFVSWLSNRYWWLGLYGLLNEARGVQTERFFRKEFEGHCCERD